MKLNKWWYVYVLQNKNNRWYIGSTNNYKERILSHNQGKNKATKPYLPWKLIYLEVSLSKNDTRAREKYLKSGMGRRYLKNRLKFFLTSNL